MFYHPCLMSPSLVLICLPTSPPLAPCLKCASCLERITSASVKVPRPNQGKKQKKKKRKKKRKTEKTKTQIPTDMGRIKTSLFVALSLGASTFSGLGHSAPTVHPSCCAHRSSGVDDPALPLAGVVPKRNVLQVSGLLFYCLGGDSQTGGFQLVSQRRSMHNRCSLKKGRHTCETRSANLIFPRS